MVDYGFRPTGSFTIGETSGIKLDLSTSVLMDKLNELKVTMAYRQRETVAIENIPDTQTDMEIKLGLANLLHKRGDLEKFVKPGETVVIKPNIVSDHGLKNGVYKGGIVTDIRLIKALVEMLLPVAMRIMGIDPMLLPPVHLAYLQGLGPLEADKIRIIGPSIAEMTSQFEQPEFNHASGQDISIHVGNACQGCRAYFHFTLSKLRKPDPQNTARHVIDRPFDNKVNIYLGPATEGEINPEETNIFIGICQQHDAHLGAHPPGCPPHTEVLIESIYSLFPDLEKAKYADQNEETKLGQMLQEIMAANKANAVNP